MTSSASVSTPPPAGPWTIRPLLDADHDAVLHLNARNHPALASLDRADLAELRRCDGHHFVAVDATGAVIGYLLSFPRESRYDDTEIRELRRRLAEPFLYICQIVVAREYRQQQVGRAFYQRMEDLARRQNIHVLCCDVNTSPPNPESKAFHRRLGFSEIGGPGIAADGGTRIAFFARRF